MSGRLTGGIVFIIFGIILLTKPWQLFERNGPDMVKLVKTNQLYKKYLKVIGYIILGIGILIEFSLLI